MYAVSRDLRRALVACLLVVALGLSGAAVAAAAPPANDLRGAAELIPPAGGSFSGSTADATGDADEPDHAGASLRADCAGPVDPDAGCVTSAWFSWTPDGSGTARLTTCAPASSLDAVVAVYPPAGDIAIASANDDAACPSNLFAATTTFPATSGETYEFAVAGAAAAGGDFAGSIGLLPTVTTGAAGSITTTSASVAGSVDPGGSPTTYQVEYGTTTGYGSSSDVQNLAAGNAPVATSSGLTGLTAGTTYHYRVVATNSAGSVEGDDATFDTVPYAPGVLTSAATGTGSADTTLNGWLTPNGVVSTYYFEYGTTTTYGSVTATEPVSAGNDPVPVSAAISGLAPGTQYHFRLVGSSAGGTVNGDDGTFTTAPLPPAVATSAATGVGSGGATLNGTVDPNGVGASHHFEYGLSTAYGSSTSSQSLPAGDDPVAVDAPISGLLPGTQYHFRLVASGAGGGPISGGDQTFTTDAALPTATTGSTTATGSVTATVAGSVNPGGAVTTYRVEYGPTVAYGQQTTVQELPAGTSPAAVSVALSALTPATLYHYRVVATNAAGPQVNGDDATFTTKPAPVATTDTADMVTTTTAKIRGAIDTNGNDTDVQFEYGLTTAYGGLPAASMQAVPGGPAPVVVSDTLSGLTPNTSYHYRLRANVPGGTPSLGADQTFTTLPLRPVATTSAATAVGVSTATLNGTVDPKGAQTVSYFEYGPTAGYGTTVALPPGSTPQSPTASLAGLAPATTYHFRIVSANAGGIATGTDQTFTTDPVPPVVTTDDAIAVTATKAILTGTVDPDGGPARSYRFQWGTTAAYGRNTLLHAYEAGNSPQVASAQLEGLLPSTTYHYRLVVETPQGQVSGAEATFTTSTPVVVSSPPVAFTAVASQVTQNAATLNGAINPLGNSTSYRFDFGRTVGYGNTTAPASAGSGVGSKAVSVRLVGLQPSTTYHYRAVAVGTTTVFGADRSFTTPAKPIVKPPLPTANQIRLAFKGLLTAAKKSTVRGLAKRPQLLVPFIAPAKGKFRIDIARSADEAPKPVAIGKLNPSKAGPAVVTIKFTNYGRKLLRLAKEAKRGLTLSATLVFTAAGGPPVVQDKPFPLRK